MTTTRIAIALAMMFSSTGLLAQQGGKIKESNAHIGLVYPLSTNGVAAAEYRNKFSLHAIGGLSASEESFFVFQVLAT